MVEENSPVTYTWRMKVVLSLFFYQKGTNIERFFVIYNCKRLLENKSFIVYCAQLRYCPFHPPTHPPSTQTIINVANFNLLHVGDFCSLLATRNNDILKQRDLPVLKKVENLTSHILFNINYILNHVIHIVKRHRWKHYANPLK